MTSPESLSSDPFETIGRSRAYPCRYKYKAKNFIDTIVYRTGDRFGAWTTPALGWLGLGLRGVSLVAAPMAAIWLVNSLWLGLRQQRMSQEADENT